MWHISLLFRIPLAKTVHVRSINEMGHPQGRTSRAMAHNKDLHCLTMIISTALSLSLIFGTPVTMNYLLFSVLILLLLSFKPFLTPSPCSKTLFIVTLFYLVNQGSLRLSSDNLMHEIKII